MDELELGGGALATLTRLGEMREAVRGDRPVAGEGVGPDIRSRFDLGDQYLHEGHRAHVRNRTHAHVASEVIATLLDHGHDRSLVLGRASPRSNAGCNPKKKQRKNKEKRHTTY